mgnify:FL=1
MTAQQKFELSVSTLATLATILAVVVGASFWLSAVESRADEALSGQLRISAQIEGIAARTMDIERNAAVTAEQFNAIRLTLGRIERKLEKDEAQ